MQNQSDSCYLSSFIKKPTYNVRRGSTSGFNQTVQREMLFPAFHKVMLLLFIDSVFRTSASNRVSSPAAGPARVRVSRSGRSSFRHLLEHRAGPGLLRAPPARPAHLPAGRQRRRALLHRLARPDAEVSSRARPDTEVSSQVLPDAEVSSQNRLMQR